MLLQVPGDAQRDSASAASSTGAAGDGWSRRRWPRQKQRERWPFLTAQQVELFKEVFDLFDTDGKGFFTADELMEVMTAMGGTPTPAEVQGVLYEMDANSDHVVDFAEFLSKFYSCMSKEQILSVFNQLAIQQDSTDSSKHLTMGVLEKCFAYVADPLSDTDKVFLEIMFKGADKDGSGTLDIDEFMKYLEKLEDDMAEHPTMTPRGLAHMPVPAIPSPERRPQQAQLPARQGERSGSWHRSTGGTESNVMDGLVSPRSPVAVLQRGAPEGRSTELLIKR